MKTTYGSLGPGSVTTERERKLLQLLKWQAKNYLYRIQSPGAKIRRPTNAEVESQVQLWLGMDPTDLDNYLAEFTP